MADPLVLRENVEMGAVLTAQEPGQVRSFARSLEGAGFDSIWVGDHISFHVPILESLTLLSHVAAVTERVALGTSVYLLPLRHPTTTAKVAATVDHLSGGRLRFGVGVGGEFPPEFEASGVPVGERGSRANEAIAVLRKLWSGERVSHEGRHFNFGPVQLAPPPARPGGPPILVGGRKPPALRRAGRLGDGYISHMCSPDMYGQNLDQIRHHAEAAGRSEVPFDTQAFVFTILGEDYDVCHRQAAQVLEMIYARPFDEAARKYCLLGRPADCLEQMRRFVDAGCRGFILSPLMAPDEFLVRARDELLPAMQSFRP